MTTKVTLFFFECICSVSSKTSSFQTTPSLLHETHPTPSSETPSQPGTTFPASSAKLASGVAFQGVDTDAAHVHESDEQNKIEGEEDGGHGMDDSERNEEDAETSRKEREKKDVTPSRTLPEKGLVKGREKDNYLFIIESRS